MKEKVPETQASIRPSEGPLELLERSDHLADLEGSLAAVSATSKGQLVFVGGEAGVGKTVVLRRFAVAHRRSVTVLWGSCDALITPRPLGALLDIAQVTGGDLQALVQGGARPHEVVTALGQEIRSKAPMILVLEDVHWADDATLDVLRLLGRRIGSIPALVLASYRDDALDRSHPLRILLGELATESAVDRLKIPPLSRAAVGELSEVSGVNATELYRTTAGNPFFVTEVLATGDEEIPHTVRDAVLSRAARLSPAAQKLLDAVAVVPPHAELWLLEAIERDTVGKLEECLSSGMLRTEPGGVAFRHELARLAVDESVSPDRRVALHRRVLAALAEPPSGEPDLARLAHHAEAAGDSEAVLQIAPRAGEQAASLGAQREAAAQYARALRFGGGLPLEERAELLDRMAHAHFLTDQNNEAIQALEQALEFHRKLGDRRREGNSLRALSQALWCPGRTAEARAAGEKAVAVLQPLPPGRGLAMAYSNLSAIYKDADDADETRAWGTRALELAERLDDVECLVHALTNIAVAKVLSGEMEGTEELERGLKLAQLAGLEVQVARGFVLGAWGAVRTRSYAVADSYIDRGLKYCGERGFELWRLYLLAYRARSELDQGRWTEAIDSADLVLRVPKISTVPRINALVVLGLVRARRGDGDQWSPLEQALALAEPSGELQRIAPVAAARAEAAWLEGRREVVVEATEAALDLAVERQASWAIGELASWRRRAGAMQEIPSAAAEPYALEIAADWSRAAEKWAEIGCPYEAALARAGGGERDEIRRAFASLQDLQARASIGALTRDLRERGVEHIPRGPRDATRSDPAGLTVREAQVLELIDEGLRNADIAGRLFLSERTVAHHVSSILTKLGVSSRGAAASKARELRRT